MSTSNPSYPVKSPLSIEEQIELLKSRNLVIEDEEFAKKVLTHISYYRLSGYSLNLRKDNIFYPGITFNTIYKIYEFDKKLRYLILDLIEIVEISFRTHIANHLALRYGPLCYTDAQYFENKEYHNEFLLELYKEIEKNKKELFIKHHLEKYNANFPIWVAVEVMSFGTLSRLFSNLKNEDRNYISKTYYKFPAVYITTWLRSLVVLRNICAHYGRIYNRQFPVVPKLGQKDKKLGISKDRLFVFIFILKYLIKDNQKWTNFTINLQALIEEFADIVDISLIGFPNNWITLLEK
ncbi:Abi family protein [Thermoclostridium stercorarium]|uniref:Abi family protein n=1 Tax=Thermoclostridium stercorarium TaxID=1510 RepID=UPI0022490E20|nr:Abi family protein [Thermoclostridium stercorarium]UZQ86049.1 Abi family protein [Thermoclostridium stercorarium]